jgi:predicted transcriptional regulator
MSDKTLVMEALQRLPEDATLVDVRKEIEFITAVKEGREQVRRGEVVSLDEVEKKIHKWATK